jgi:hypothetical protein
MQQLPAPPTWRLIDWIIVPIYRPEYRRLLLWSFTLSMRLQLLSLMVTIVSPVATPGLLLLLRRRFENLRIEVAEFKRAVHAPRSRLLLQREMELARQAPVAVEATTATAYENPWV